jgi:hypothetical protein
MPELLHGAVDKVEACGLGTNVSLREGDLGAGALELGRHALAACRGRRRESRDIRPRESRALFGKKRVLDGSGGRAAGGSHKSARGVSRIVSLTEIRPVPGDFGGKVALLAGLGNQ